MPSLRDVQRRQQINRQRLHQQWVAILENEKVKNVQPTSRNAEKRIDGPRVSL